MDLVYHDIPRMYTAIAEWGACAIYIIILKRRFHYLKTGIMALLFLLMQSIIMVFTESISIYFWIPVMILATISMYIFMSVSCDEKPMVKIYCTACAFLISEFAASFEWLLYYYLAYPRGIQSEILKFGLLIVIYSVIFYIIWLVEKSLLDRNTELHISRKETTLVLVIVLVVFMISNLSFVYPDTPFSSSFFYEVFKLRTLFDCAGVIVLLAFQTHMRELIVASELSAINAVLRSHYRQYIHYQESMEMISIKYHDLKHQIMGLRAETEEEKRNVWLDNMESEIDSYKIVNTTGNKVLDAILDGKITMAKRHNIEITYVVDGKLLDFIHVTDLCTIFGNALDNAIEAEVLEPIEEHRLIHVSVSAQRKFVFIKIENYCSQPVHIGNGFLKTTKSDTQRHGYGLKSIRYSTEKYNGVMTITMNKNWFVLNIIMPQSE